MATSDRRKHARRAIAVVAITLGAAVLPAAAQESKGLTVDVGDCPTIEKPEERLACFEAQVAAARQRAAPGPTSAAPASASVAATPASVVAAPAGVAAAAASEPPVPRTDAAVESQKSASEPRTDGHRASAQSDAERPPEPASSSARGSEPQPAEIVAKVAELRETVPNAWLITLDNGQVWRQTHAIWYPLRQGLDVRVRSTRFGYRLSAPELHGQIQVERVR